MKIAHIIEAEGSNDFHFPFSTHILELIVSTQSLQNMLMSANDQYNVDNSNDN